MREIDVDEDGCLCLIDLFSVFYLTEIYMQALGGKGFLTPGTFSIWLRGSVILNYDNMDAKMVLLLCFHSNS